MDTLMDALSQKLNAQEMIRANNAAESEQMNSLRIQVQEYQSCLDRMQQLCTSISDIEHQIMTNAASQTNQNHAELQGLKLQVEQMAQESGRRLEAMSQESTAQLSQMQQAQQQMQQTQQQMQEDFSQKLEGVGTEESIHKECVRFYRNVQAVVQEEAQKQTAAMQEGNGKLKKQMTAVLVLAILSFLASGASLAISVMQYFF